MENIYVQFGGMVYQQIVGIPMGTKLWSANSRLIFILLREGFYVKPPEIQTVWPHRQSCNRCVIEVFGGVCVLSFGFRIFCWYRGFCHRTESNLLLFLLIDKFNDNSRYLDDIFTIDNPDFAEHIPDIYPRELPNWIMQILRTKKNLKFLRLEHQSCW